MPTKRYSPLPYARRSDRQPIALATAFAIASLGFFLATKMQNEFTWYVIHASYLAAFLAHGYLRRHHDRKLSRLEYHKAAIIHRAIIVSWASAGAVFLRAVTEEVMDLFWLVAMLFVGGMGLIDGMIFGACQVFLFPPKARVDSHLYCRECDYRVDNIPGPYCPECGTQVFAAADDHEFRIASLPDASSNGE